MSKVSKKSKREIKAELDMLAQAAATWAGFDARAQAEIDLTLVANAYVAELGNAAVAAADALKRGKPPSVTVDKGKRRLIAAARRFVRDSAYKAPKITKAPRAAKAAR